MASINRYQIFTAAFIGVQLMLNSFDRDMVEKCVEKGVTFLQILDKISVKKFLEAIMPLELKRDPNFRKIVESISSQTIYSNMPIDARKILDTPEGRKWLEKNVEELKKWLLE